MATSELDLLRDRIFADADNELNRRIREAFAPILKQVRTLDIQFDAFEINQTAQPTTVRVSGENLVRILRDAIFADNSAQMRTAYVNRFIQSVNEKEL